MSGQRDLGFRHKYKTSYIIISQPPAAETATKPFTVYMKTHGVHKRRQRLYSYILYRIANSRPDDYNDENREIMNNIG